MSEDLCDVRGVPLHPGQRVLYAGTGLFSTGALTWGTVVKAYTNFDGRQFIQIKRDDGKHIVLTWSRRVLVMEQAQDPEADAWLRRQLSTLGK